MLVLALGVSCLTRVVVCKLESIKETSVEGGESRAWNVTPELIEVVRTVIVIGNNGDWPFNNEAKYRWKVKKTNAKGVIKKWCCMMSLKFIQGQMTKGAYKMKFGI